VRGEDAFDDLMGIFDNPLMLVLDAGLVGIVAFHALNGIRLILLDMSIGLRYQKVLFWIAFIVALGVFIGSVVALRNIIAD
jgi:succinate dehydrogenase / fumarate reductase cytochrome b subunit